MVVHEMGVPAVVLHEIGPTDPPILSFAFKARFDVAEALDLGSVDGTRKRMVPIVGGTCRGPKVEAAILPGGADWQFIGDEVTHIAARAVARMNDGTLFALDLTGIRRSSKEVTAQMATGAVLPPSSYYSRLSGAIDMPDGSHGHHWLGECIYVCKAVREKGQVVVDFFSVH